MMFGVDYDAMWEVDSYGAGVGKIAWLTKARVNSLCTEMWVLLSVGAWAILVRNKNAQYSWSNSRNFRS